MAEAACIAAYRSPIMRLFLALVSLVAGLSGPVRADRFDLASPVTAVTVYDQGAEIVRRVPFSVPAGQHDLVLQDLPASTALEWVRVQVEGAQAGPVTLRSEFTPPRSRAQPREVRAAEARVGALERQIEGVKDRAATARLAADAAATRNRFLGDLGKADGMSATGPDTLRALSRMIGEEALDAARAAQSGEIDARRIERALEPLEEQLADARQALAALTPDDEERAYLSVAVTAEAPAEGTLTVRYYTAEAAWWPVYDLRLDRKAGVLVIERGAYVGQDTGESWRDVDLVLSTARPADDMRPPAIWPQQRRVIEPMPERNVGAAPPPVAESPVIVDNAAAAADLSGYAVTYVYPEPVDIATEADAVRLRLGTLTLEADTEARAVAKPWQTSAVLTAQIINDSGEEILPSRQSSLYVDGTFVGATETEGIAANDEADLFFGPIRGLLLTRVVKAENEGNSGIINRSSQQSETAELTLRNLTGEEWAVTVLDQVPYSTQEDLRITWRADPRPDVIDWEDMRGVLAWKLTLAPKETRNITLGHTLDWPEGKELR